MTEQQYRRRIRITAIISFLAGFVITYIVNSNPFNSLTSPGQEIDLEKAKGIKKNFEKKRPPFVFGFPKTECVVHKYTKLKKYLEGIQNFFDTTQESYSGYEQGVALYFARADRGNFYGKDEPGKPGSKPVLKPKNNTVFLVPVYYKEKKDSTKDGNKYIVYTVIDTLKSPLNINLPFTKASEEDSVMYKAADAAVKAFDLGHTYP